jgi:hypothetical protein
VNRQTRKTNASLPTRPYAQVAAPEDDTRPLTLLREWLSGLQRLVRAENTQPFKEITAVRVTLRSPWRAVSVVPGKACCIASQELDARYLCEDAPRLPLANCSNPRGCQCVYRHFEDRRKGPRRSRDGGTRPPAMHHAFQGGGERRLTAGGRRAAD